MRPHAFGDFALFNGLSADLVSIPKGRLQWWDHHPDIYFSLDEETKNEFIELRSATTWRDRSEPWENRANEHAAEAITWAIADYPFTPHVLIGNRSCDALAAAYRMLTGFEPPDGRCATDPAVTIAGGSADDHTAADTVIAEFEAVGFELPPLTITFSDNTGDCGGNAGLHTRPIGTIAVCTSSPWTIAHEIAHAWIDTNVSDETRQAYVDHFGLETWRDHNFKWNQRGTERAAETIAAALLLENPEPPAPLRAYLCSFELLAGKPLPITLVEPCEA